MRKWWVLIGVWSLSGLSSLCGLGVIHAQSISSFVSSPEILIGQPDTLTIKIVSPLEQVQLPSFEDTLSGSLEIIAVGPVDSAVTTEGFEFTQQLYFTSFDTGIFVAPPVQFYVDSISYASQGSVITVVDIKVDLSQNIHGIQDIEQAPITLKEVLLVVGIVLLCSGGAWLLFWLGRRYYQKYQSEQVESVVEAPVVPFMDTFWERLAHIEQAKYWQKGEVKKFHSLVTSLMRAYLEYRYGVSAMEQTTDEILAQLQVLVTDKMLFAKIEQTLRFADMVKFAKATGVQMQHEKAIDNLKELISLTELKPSNQGE